MTSCNICKVRGEMPQYGDFVVLVGTLTVEKRTGYQRADGCRWPSTSFRRLGPNEIVCMFPELDDDIVEATDFKWE